MKSTFKTRLRNVGDTGVDSEAMLEDVSKMWSQDGRKAQLRMETWTELIDDGQLSG